MTAATATYLRGVRRIHFVGIGGAGMSGIAEVLLKEGHEVTGSDLVASTATRHLTSLGATTRVGHSADAFDASRPPDVVVTSSAIAADNAEVERARERGIPVIPRAQMLGEMMRHRIGIAVAGAHGKTTTASMVAALFAEAGLDPTYVIGGRLLRAAADEAGATADEVGAGSVSGAALGSGAHMIAEADESDASFLHLHPIVAVVTNIDRDHLEAYGQDFAHLRRAFVDFLHRLPFFGLAIVGIDEQPGRALAAEVDRPLSTFGFSQDADYRASNVKTVDGRSRFVVQRRGHRDIELRVPTPGRHNVLNALAAVAVASEEGIDDDAIVRGLAGFGGVTRRFERSDRTIAGHPVTLVDDYGHHPAEVAQVIATARALWPARRLVMVYQPHRYTRTRDLFDEFVDVLGQTDELVLLDVYAAGEPVLPEVGGRVLARAVCRRGLIAPSFADSLEQAAQLLRERVQDDDVLLVQGAGDIEHLPRMLGPHPHEGPGSA